MSKLTDYLIYYLPLNGSLTPAIGAITPTVTGATNWASGVIGQAFNFGTPRTGYLNFASPYIATSTTWTWNVWVYRTALLGSGAAILDQSYSGGDEKTFIDNTGDVRYGVGNNSTLDLLVNLNQWTMLTFTSEDGATGRYYVNGVRSAYLFNPSIHSHAPLSVSHLGIDLNYDYQGNYFNGRMCEFAVWDRALSPAEVLSLYNGGAGTNLIASTPITTTPSTPKLLDSLVSWHSLDGNLSETSSNGVGALTASTTMVYQPGLRGQQCINTYLGGYATYNPTAPALDGWFGSIWFMINGNTTDGGLLVASNDACIKSYSSGYKLRWYLSSDVASSADITTNTWHHIVFGHNSMQGQLQGVVYLDGKLHIHTVQNNLTPLLYPYRVGANSAGTKFYGLLQDAAWWNRSLTLSDVALLWNDGKGLSYAQARKLYTGARPKPPTPFFVTENI